MKLSVVIPAHNEEGCIESTVRVLWETLKKAGIDHEILVVNDNSNDSTQGILERLQREIDTLNVVVNRPPNGFGFAVRRGLEEFTGDVVCIFMADASDDPNDVVKYYHLLLGNGVDCMFGSRFMKGGKVVDYPALKLAINRMANLFIQSLFGLRFNDVTNAFKMYRREVIEGAQPLMSHHFNLTVELPLKAIVRGYTYAAMPISWTNRKTGVSKLKIQEMGSRYLFIVIYCFIEKWLARGDYHRGRRPVVAPSLTPDVSHTAH